VYFHICINIVKISLNVLKMKTVYVVFAHARACVCVCVCVCEREIYKFDWPRDSYEQMFFISITSLLKCLKIY